MPMEFIYEQPDIQVIAVSLATGLLQASGGTEPIDVNPTPGEWGLTGDFDSIF